MASSLTYAHLELLKHTWLPGTALCLGHRRGFQTNGLFLSVTRQATPSCQLSLSNLEHCLWPSAEAPSIVQHHKIPQMKYSSQQIHPEPKGREHKADILSTNALPKDRCLVVDTFLGMFFVGINHIALK